MPYIFQDKHIEVVHVVAFDRAGCIGVGNQLPWHIKEDLQHFKRITEHGVVIMGRKTFESTGRPLPHRVNWVITRDSHYQAEGVHIAHSLQDALQGAAPELFHTEKKSLFIIGGGEIFKQSMPITDRLEITHVDVLVEHGEAFYPAIPTDFHLIQEQGLVSEKDHISLRFCRYERL